MGKTCRYTATATLINGEYVIDLECADHGPAPRAMRIPANRIHQVMEDGMLAVVLGELPESVFFAVRDALKKAGVSGMERYEIQ